MVFHLGEKRMYIDLATGILEQVVMGTCSLQNTSYTLTLRFPQTITDPLSVRAAVKLAPAASITIYKNRLSRMASCTNENKA